MKKAVILFVLYILNTVIAFGGGGGGSPEVVNLPEVARLKISTENEMQLEDVHFLPGGTVGFNDAYVSAVVFKDKIKNCSIFIYSGDDLYGAYDGAPCEFIGAAEIDWSRGAVVPDIYYRVKVFSLRLGANVNDLVAFYYDSGAKRFCESRSLATWRTNGKKDIRPDLSDGVCGAVQ